MTPLVVEATYENGTLKLAQPLPLKEHEKVRVTIESRAPTDPQVTGMVRCDDAALIECAATDPDLAYPEPRDTP